MCGAGYNALFTSELYPPAYMLLLTQLLNPFLRSRSYLFEYHLFRYGCR